MSQPWKDYYGIIGLDPSATTQEVAQRRRDLAKLFHPRTKDSDQERMTEINAACDVLEDPDKKAAYDRTYASDKKRNTDTRTTDTPPTPSPPPPPKIYHPVLRINPDSVVLEVEEGESVSFSCRVDHISGELPPRWKPRVFVSGKILDGVNPSADEDQKTRFPITIKATIPAQMVGSHTAEIEVSVEEIK